MVSLACIAMALRWHGRTQKCNGTWALTVLSRCVARWLANAHSCCSWSPWAAA
ncbi:hypothetical protein PR001_g32279 [Phytophthora rubi]|uniref:Uncharacterized protein n=1 Tax=Phytophthora rubi TaxID=129364 RepID=A0A6A3GCD9_9STRA|nr:hypothetical protein PR001_g32279 [Phytophthora rubi]